MEKVVVFVCSFIPLAIWIIMNRKLAKDNYKDMTDSNKMIIDTLTHGKIENGGYEHKGIRIQGGSVGLTSEAINKAYPIAMRQLNHIKIVKNDKKIIK